MLRVSCTAPAALTVSITIMGWAGGLRASENSETQDFQRARRENGGLSLCRWLGNEQTWNWTLGNSMA